MRALAAGWRAAVIRPIATTTGSGRSGTAPDRSPSSSGIPLRTTATRGACRPLRASSASASDTAPSSALRRAISASTPRTTARTGAATPVRANARPCGV